MIPFRLISWTTTIKHNNKIKLSSNTITKETVYVFKSYKECVKCSLFHWSTLQPCKEADFAWFGGWSKATSVEVEKKTGWTNISCSESGQASVFGPLVAFSIPYLYPTLSSASSWPKAGFTMETVRVDSVHKEQRHRPLLWCRVRPIVEMWVGWRPQSLTKMINKVISKTFSRGQQTYLRM